VLPGEPGSKADILTRREDQAKFLVRENQIGALTGSPYETVEYPMSLLERR